ncbi:MAG: T9SS type A sorting domain-containing protein [Bacteroidia bacterium]
MKKKLSFALALIVTLVSCQSIKAQTYNYVPDSTFDGNGLQSFIFFNNIDRMYGCDLQTDEKVIMAGLSKNSNTGSFELCIVRLNVDGSFDSTFNGDGIAYISMGNQNSIGGQTPKVKIAPNGKIVIANTGFGSGSQDLLLCMLDTNGVLDPTFNSTGTLFVDMLGTNTQPDIANALDIDAQGNIYAIGSTRTAGSPLDNDFAIVKVNQSGQLVNTFSGDGKLLFNPNNAADFGRGIKVQSDGKIVFGGSSGSNMMIGRIDSTGTLDVTFNTVGHVTITFQLSSDMGALDLDQNERIVVAGKLLTSNSNIAVARYKSNGLFDPNFGFNGKYVFNVGGFANNITAMHIQPDNKILLGGFMNDSNSISKFCITRVDTAGSIDLTLGGLGFVRQPVIVGNVDEECNGMAVMSDGRVILTGTTVYGSAINEDVAVCRIKPVLVTSTQEINGQQMISAYPNPFSDEIQIASKEKGSGSLVDLSGRILQSFQLNAGLNSISTTTLPAGMYFIRFNEIGAIRMIKP